MKTVAKCASVAVALTALTATIIIADTTPANASASTPTGCYSKAMNNFPAWPAAYATCSGGVGHIRVVGKFRNLAGDGYSSNGPCVAIGKTSTVYAAGYFDSATGALVKYC
jgi:hypothetical protein